MKQPHSNIIILNLRITDINILKRLDLEDELVYVI